MNLEAVIGLEIHVQLKTQSKMFCSCANIVTGEIALDGTQVKPNSAICPICMGYPGTLPAPNKQAIEWIQRAGAALGCELHREAKFDRKHYFYPDLPKGYQISQYDQPFCGEGQVEVVVGGDVTRVGIERIHLEEDAAKNTHPAKANYTLVDYNRAGTPLMEIVTKPDLVSSLQAKLFLQELQRIMRAVGVSDADMEKGQMRCDANISLRPKGEPTLHPKTEIKNVNSFRFVERAIEYEIDRQTKLWEAGEPPAGSATRGFNSEQGITVAQREKEEAADYRYFPEPDIPPFVFTEADLAARTSEVPELPGAKRVRFMKEYGLSEQWAELLVADEELSVLLEESVSEVLQIDNEQVSITSALRPKLIQLIATILIEHVRPLIQKGQKFASQQPARDIASLAAYVQLGDIPKRLLQEIVERLHVESVDIEELAREQKSQSGAVDTETLVNEVIAANPDVVDKIKSGKGGAIQFLVGQVMARSKGQADPAEAREILQRKLG